MSAPIYFFPKVGRGDVVRDDRLLPSVLAQHGLADVLDDVHSVDRECFCQDLATKGPGGQSGVLLCVFPPDGVAPKRLGFYPEFQEWAPCSDAGVWLGTDREEPPRARDLVRRGGGRDIDGAPKAPHDGYNMKLADGTTWTVPVIRRPPLAVDQGYRATDLPRDIGWDTEGKFVETIKPAYLQLWNETAAIADFFFEGSDIRRGDFRLTVEEALAWCLRGLNLNYRLGRFEQSRLHLIDAGNVYAVLGAFVDYPLVLEMLKSAKKKLAQ